MERNLAVIGIYVLLLQWLTILLVAGAYSGLHERMLLEDLLAYYNKLERPVANESEAVVLTFGLTLQQIIDVVIFVGEKKNLISSSIFIMPKEI